jgi:hypothetical protein
VNITYKQLLDRVISDGITEVRVVYADPEDHHKRDGAIEGFEACREKSPAQLVELWRETEAEAAQMRNVHADDLKAYWRLRYKALQIEWVLNVLTVGFQKLGYRPLLGHLPTARAVMKYVEIVGLRDDLPEEVEIVGLRDDLPEEVLS